MGRGETLQLMPNLDRNPRNVNRGNYSKTGKRKEGSTLLGFQRYGQTEGVAPEKPESKATSFPSPRTGQSGTWEASPRASLMNG